MPSPDQNDLSNYQYLQNQARIDRQHQQYQQAQYEQMRNASQSDDMAALQNRGMYNQNFNIPSSTRLTQALDIVRQSFNVDYRFNYIAHSHAFTCNKPHCVIHLPAEAESRMTVTQIAEFLINSFTNQDTIKGTNLVSPTVTKTKFDLLNGE